MSSTSGKTRRPRSIDAALEQLEERHRVLAAELAGLGLMLRGSIAKRLTRCGTPGCRCKADPPQLHGPYWLWTRTVSGKTVTVQLPPEQAALCRQWNHNMHRADEILRELGAIGLEAATLVRRR